MYEKCKNMCRGGGNLEDTYLATKKSAFTLAEVLITLGIIGIIAAITIPILIQNYKNNVVETRLKKMYSIMNQAIIMSEDNNGNLEEWNFDNKDFLNTYIIPYLNKTDIKKIDATAKYSGVYLSDGSLIITKNIEYGAGLGANLEYFFYPDAKNFNFSEFNGRKYSGSKFFLFRLVYPNSECNPLHKKGFEPYICGLNKSNDPNKDGIYACNKENTYKFYCTYAIQRNGWKIPKDYPVMVK